MRTILCIVQLVFVEQLLPQSGPSMSNTDVVQAEREWNDAYIRRDFGKLKTIMANDFMDMNDDGTFDNKRTNLQSTKSGEQKFTVLSCSNVVTRRYGDVSINTGILHMELLFRGKPSMGDFLFTDVWQKRNGRWQVVASAETPTEAQQKKDQGKPKPVLAGEFKAAAEVYRGFPKTSREIESTVFKVDGQLSEACIKKDMSQLESLLADDLTDIWDDGFMKNKQQDIAAVIESSGRFFEFSPFGSIVRAYGDVAILLGSTHNRRQSGGHELDENLNGLKVYHRDGTGAWKLVASQSIECARQPSQGRAEH